MSNRRHRRYHHRCVPRRFRGTISYIADAVDPNTRTLQARIVTENPGHKLKKDMYVTATVQRRRDSATRSWCPTPPSCAIPKISRSFTCKAAANQFARRLVTIGDSHDGRTQITSGLKEGENVIGDGSLFLQFKNSLQH